MMFKMLIQEFLNYNNVEKKDILKKGRLNDKISDGIAKILKSANIKNPNIQESLDYYFITLTQTSDSDNLINIFKREFNLADLTFERGTLSMTFLK